MRSLIRLLEKLPRKRLQMTRWLTDAKGEWMLSRDFPKLWNDCRTAACGCGWAVTIPSVRKVTERPYEVASKAFGFRCESDYVAFNSASTALFGSHRTCTPKRLAADLRRYLKDGTLPTS